MSQCKESSSWATRSRISKWAACGKTSTCWPCRCRAPSTTWTCRQRPSKRWSAQSRATPRASRRSPSLPTSRLCSAAATMASLCTGARPTAAKWTWCELPAELPSTRIRCRRSDAIRVRLIWPSRAASTTRSNSSTCTPSLMCIFAMRSDIDDWYIYVCILLSCFVSKIKTWHETRLAAAVAWHKQQRLVRSRLHQPSKNFCHNCFRFY